MCRKKKSGVKSKIQKSNSSQFWEVISYIYIEKSATFAFINLTAENFKSQFFTVIIYN